MNLKDWKIVFISTTALLAFFIYSPLLVDLLPPQKEENFFSLAILGSEGKSDDYYTGREPEITLNNSVKWNIYIYNHMNQAQQILIKIKLLSPTDTQPNTSTCSPSSNPSIYEIKRAMSDNETLTIPFEWKVTDITQQEEKIILQNLQINDFTTDLTLVAQKQDTLRFLFELWVYNTENQEFEFSWLDVGESRCVWNQIQFELI
jgi:hypothetical protein